MAIRSFEQLERREMLAAVYHVALNGSDSSAGSQTAPWLTLQKAANSVVAGDSVVVRPGAYRGFQLTRDGTTAAPITFSAEPGVLIDRPNAITPDGINLQGADYVVIEGFTVIGMPRAGIRSAVNHHVTVRNNRCDQNGVWGIFSGFSDDFTIENNETSRSVEEHGIYVSNSGDRPVIRGNRVWGNSGNGIHMNGDLSQGGDGIISGALVEANVIWENGAAGGSGINADGVQSSTFRNNLLYDNHASGISLYQIDGADGSRNNVVVNNTVVQATDGRWALNIQDASTGNRVLNNIFYNKHSFRGSIDIAPEALPGFVSDYNVVMSRFTTNGGDTRLTLAQWRTATGQDMHSQIATPAQLFNDPTGDDYHLRLGSPAIDTGIVTFAPAVDFEADLRPLGTAVDIGADEFSPADANPPHVVSVMLRGSAWNPAVPAVTLPPANSGSPPLLSWLGIESVTVTFDEPVVVAADDLTVSSVASAGGSLTIAQFEYDSSARTARWRLAAPVSRDRLTLAIDAAVTDLAANALAGPRTFFANVLAGDVNATGAVTRADLVAVARRSFRALGSAQYDPRHDINGDGRINHVDLAAVVRNLGTTLPAGSPAVESSAVSSPIGGPLRATRRTIARA